MPAMESASPSAHAISVAEGRKDTILATGKHGFHRGLICGYGSPSPFLPFFFAGSASRGRVAGGGGASTFGVAASGLGCAGAGWASVFGGGGIASCSNFGSVV